MRGPVVLPAAEQDMADAALWYESRSTGLGAEFLGKRPHHHRKVG